MNRHTITRREPSVRSETEKLATLLVIATKRQALNYEGIKLMPDSPEHERSHYLGTCTQSMNTLCDFASKPKNCL